MGGYILQTLVFNNPSLVKKAIISNSAMNIHTCFHFYVDAQRELLLAEAPLKSLIKASCCWTFSYKFLSESKVLDDLIEWSLSDPHAFTMNGYVGQYAALDNFDSTAWVGKITKPVLVIGGDQDLIFSEPIIRSLAESIPQSQYYCFKECGHLPFIEYPEEFVKLIESFIVPIL
jgi:pimeloyl-ACP methyl ester carboxylesterase